MSRLLYSSSETKLDNLRVSLLDFLKEDCIVNCVYDFARGDLGVAGGSLRVRCAPYGRSARGAHCCSSLRLVCDSISNCGTQK